MIHNLIIKPLIGIDGLSLGSKMTDVLKILGEPDNRTINRFGKDKSWDAGWDYLNHGLKLTFSSDDNWLLGSITTDSADAELAGYYFIGLDEKVFLKAVKAADIPPVILDDDFKELGSRNYSCDELGLSFWVQDGTVSNITIFPEYDESGNIPLWPTE